jgi:transcriptional regulator with XRE-family HTH domain
MKTLGSRLKHLRENVLKISQARLAAELDAAGVHGGTTNVSVMRYEKDERIPGADYLRAFARLAGVTADWLLNGEEQGRGDAEVTARTDGTLEIKASSDLYAMLADVRAKEPDGLKRILEIEAISAAIRAEAALVVGRAVEREGEVADRRQQEVRRVSVGGSTAPVQSVGEPISDTEVEERGGPPSQQPEPKKRAAGE